MARAIEASTDDVVDDSTPQRYNVRLTHPNHHKKRVFSSVSKNRSETWLAAHYPRGSEAYLEYPDGRTFHYERERRGDKGQDMDFFQEFDPESWVPPEQQAPPGQDQWADQEG